MKSKARALTQKLFQSKNLLVSLLAIGAVTVAGVYLLNPSQAWHPSGSIEKTVQNLTAKGPVSDANDAVNAIRASKGDILEYTVTVQNIAPAAANHWNDLAYVVMTDDLPNGVELVSSPAARTIKEDLGTILPGKSAVRSYKVRVTETNTSLAIPNKACFSGDSLARDNKQSGCDIVLFKTTSASPVTTPPVTPPASATPSPTPPASSASPTPIAPAPIIKKPSSKTPSTNNAADPTPAPVSPAAALVTDCPDDSNATVRAGSVGATFSLPGSSATQTYIAYGTNSANLKQKSTIVTGDGQDVTLAVTGLAPGQNYSYQIVRQCIDEQLVSSSLATFTTARLDIHILYQTGTTAHAGINGLLTAINASRTSDANGIATYVGVLPGSHQLKYTYKGVAYTYNVTVPRPVLASTAAASDVIALEYPVTPGAPVAASSHAGKTMFGTLLQSWSWLWLSLILLFGLLGFILGRLLGKHRPQAPATSTFVTSPTPPSPDTTAEQDIDDVPPALSSQNDWSPQPPTPTATLPVHEEPETGSDKQE